MLRLFKHYVSVSSAMALVFDFVIMVWSAQMAGLVRFYGVESVYAHDTGWSRAILFAAIGHMSFYLLDLYRFEGKSEAVAILRRLGIAFAVYFVGLTSIYYLLPGMALGRGVFGIAFGLSAVLLAIWRLSLNWSLSMPRMHTRVAVLGAGAYAATVDDLLKETESGDILVGFIGEGEDAEPAEVPSSRILGDKKDLLEIVNRERIDKIVVALSDRRGNFPLRAILDCKMRGVQVLDLPAFYERVCGKILIKDLRPSWLIFCDGFRRTELTQVVKRASDIVFSVALLLVALPVMAVAALLIKLDSKGPILFRQERVGENGRIFVLSKFRSMRADAEENTGPVWAVKSDDRVTRIGKFMRKTRIDELPQLFNVLKGEMSFIGPRPERPYFVAKLQEKIPYYSQRHTVKPGLTGWAQVRYAYGASVEDSLEKLQYDLYYIKNMSIFLDAVVLFNTVKVVLFGKGAR